MARTSSENTTRNKNVTKCILRGIAKCQNLSYTTQCHHSMTTMVYPFIESCCFLPSVLPSSFGLWLFYLVYSLQPHFDWWLTIMLWCQTIHQLVQVARGVTIHIPRRFIMIYSGKASSNMSLCNSYNPFRKILKLFKNEKQKHNKESSMVMCY